MNLAAVVAQLRAAVPVFQGRVAGAANFATGLEKQVWLAAPAAYVIPLDDEADQNDQQNSVRQVITERIGVVVAFDNAMPVQDGDRRGQTVTTQYEPIRAALFKALLGWNVDPDRAVRGFAYAGGHLLQFDFGRLFYQFEFSLEIVLDQLDDGWLPPTEPLLSIQANTDPEDPPYEARADLPQE